MSVANIIGVLLLILPAVIFASKANKSGYLKPYLQGLAAGVGAVLLVAMVAYLLQIGTA